MPNHIGAFLKASRCFAEIGVNITRVSYNKAVDSHMLFIDAEGTADKLDEAARRLMGEDVPLELPKVRPQFSRRLKSSRRVLRGAQEPEREE